MTLRRRVACLWLPTAWPGWAAGADDAAPLRVGWGDYPPFQIKGPRGPEGLDVELLELIAHQAGERLRWLRRPWARQLADMTHGELDIICSATPAPEREAIGRFSQAYRQERVALMSLVDGAPPVSRLAELKGRGVRIGMIRGAVFPESVRRELQAHELLSVLQSLHANDLTLQALRQGRVDYVIEDPVSMQYRASKDPGPPIRVALELATSPVHLLVALQALAQRPALLDRLNQGLQRARQSPEWQQALARRRA
ncbi:MAG: amino acid ABC transporter substrate-binding protein [Burkholderiales bacterium]|nr:MAG: amino acid ABC transporter substrate-binding protein [Burkholderiales bacterium]